MMHNAPFDFPGFKCHHSIETNLNNSEHINSIETAIENKVEVFGYALKPRSWIYHFSDVFQQARKAATQILQNTIHESMTISGTEGHLNRTNLRKFFHLLLFSLKCDKNKINSAEPNLLLKMDVLLNTMSMNQLSEPILFKSASMSCNKTYHNSNHVLVHTCLDLNYLWLKIIDLEKNLELQNYLLEIMKSLIRIMLLKFYHCFPAIDEKCTPFYCPCFKEFWLLIQLHVENTSQLSFWTLFNAALEEVITKCHDVTCAIWFIYYIAEIHCFDKTGVFVGIESKRVIPNAVILQKYILKIFEGNVRKESLTLLIKLLGQFEKLWVEQYMSIDIYLTMWEYFYRRLNLSDDFNGSKSTDFNFLHKIDNIKETCDMASLDNFESYLMLLQRYVKKNELCWFKLRGRIYSKISTASLSQFTQIGLQRLFLLFFILAETLDFSVMIEKLSSIVKILPSFTDNPVVWSVYLTTMQLHIRHRLPVENLALDFLKSVDEVSANSSKRHLMNLFLSGFHDIIELDETREYGEYVLIGSWIEKYLNWSEYVDSDILFELISKIIKKIHLLNTYKCWHTKFEEHVIPAIKKSVTSGNCSSRVIHVAALLCVYGSNVASFFEYMTNSKVYIVLQKYFLRELFDIAEKKNMVFEDKQQKSIIQAYMRLQVMIPDVDQYCDIKTQVVALPYWKYKFDKCPDHDMNLLQTVLMYIEAKTCGDHSKDDLFLAKIACNEFLGKMDEWTTSLLSTVETEHLCKNIQRLFTLASKIYLKCSKAMYQKDDAHCLFVKLTNVLLLPPNNTSSSKLLNLVIGRIQETWIYFIIGILSLDFKHDKYLSLTVSELITRYVPHMSISDSPLKHTFTPEVPEDMAEFIFQKFSAGLLSHNIAKLQPELNAKVLQLCNNIISQTPENNPKLFSFLKSVLPYLYEQIIFLEGMISKKEIFKILYVFKIKPIFQRNNEIFTIILFDIINKHLSFYSAGIFACIDTVIPYFPSSTVKIMEYLEKSILTVEQRRAVEEDLALRNKYSALRKKYL